MAAGGPFSDVWEVLLSGLISKDAGAWEEFLRRCEGLARWAIQGVLKQRGGRPEVEVDDLLQDLWVFLLSDGHFSRIRNPQALRLWLVKVAENRARSLLRRRIREIPVGSPLEVREFYGAIDKSSSPAEALECAELEETVASSLDRLRKEERQIVEARFWRGEGPQETCGEQKLNRNTYWRRYRAAQKKLARSAELRRARNV